MRILDVVSSKSLKSVLLYLKIDEAKELYGDLKSLIEANDLYNHCHIDDQDYSHEITMVIYDEKDTHMLDERSQKIILKDI